MGLTRWILALCGYVRLEVCGVHPERVLNACAAAGIACTASEPVDAYTLRITVRARCADMVTELARRSQCEVKTLYRRGLPQLLRCAARYRGACAGLLVTVLVLLTSSLFIWRIDVTGNETLTTGQILRCLDECGVRPGTYWPALSNDLVRNDMVLRLPELRWLTVNVHGSRAEVVVREKQPLPDITPDDTPVSIYASATGVILSMDVYAGEARVAPGAAVEPGDVLVSGAVTDLGGGVRPVCARADIRARTRQVLTGQIALTEAEKQSAHGAHTRWALRAGKKRINFYQNSGISDAECDKIIHEWINTCIVSSCCKNQFGITESIADCLRHISRIGRRTRRFRRTRRARRSSRRCCSSCARRLVTMARSFPMKRRRRSPAAY